MEKGFKKQVIAKSREWVASLLFPTRCLVCDQILEPEQSKNGIHSHCESKLFLVSGAVCMHCGRPFRKYLRKNSQIKEDEYFDNSTLEYCLECCRRNYVTKTTPIKKAKALYIYRGAIKQVMYRFKYSNRREYASFFAKQARMRYPQLFEVDAIIPVPMYMPKQKKRGYNQATSLARELGRQMQIPVDETLLCRVKDTAPQKELDDIERKNNLKNAFQKGKSIVKYKKVLVVDDIYTTGTTIEEVAIVLKEIGIQQIYVFCICIGGEM